ncbi:hypothetical protein HTV45_11780 [Streptomyces sp. CHD11]|uniref:hypothetical protein n=1 Tax=Streptomyces sp. CHD11 TaxID=2741325 RepID=UPI001BFCAB8B|nr:hypothetical protein [Streptomyces sp. CHD11]MBT3151555.1 hypothetical protein [Streptomyces sp. CHD11]
MRRVVRGFWGPRQESAGELAARWNSTLERFALLLPEAAADGRTGWEWRTAPASGPAETVTPDEASLLGALRTARDADPWAAANGTSLRLLAAGPAPGWKVEIAALAGGTPDSLLQSLVATITAPDEASLPDAALLTVVAEVWHPDYGDVGDRAVTAALKREAGFRIGTPSVGWAGYLSAGRAARVPADLTADRVELSTGGLLLVLAAPGDTSTVVEAYQTLGKSGALEPLPRPMSRPAL